MSKVICDVCGTTYPETAAQCPICGCARNTTNQTVADSAQTGEENGTYTYVKGGRFSKSNVRKRSKGAEVRRSAAAPQKAPKNEEPSEGGGGGNKILVAIVIILLLAIVAVAAYIGIRYLVPAKPADPKPQGTQTQLPGTTTVPPTTALKIPCTGITLDQTEITLAAEGDAAILYPTLAPADTTDKPRYSSSNEAVATVTEGGKIEAVGGGEAVITVTCGEQFAQCKVICTFGNVTPPTTTVPEPDIDPDFVLKLNREDFTLSAQDSRHKLFADTDTVKASDITWTVDDETVATVTDGVVTGVDYGDTVVTATYGDQVVKCTVRIRFHAVQEDPDKPKINRTDVTIKVGETFNLILTDSVGAKINVEWTVSEEGYVSIDGNKIKGTAHTQDVAGKYITVSCTYEEETYSCKIRVTKPAEEG